MNDTQPAAQAVAPVLVRDVAEVLGVSVAHINSALIIAGCAPRSTNMEISGEELLAVAAAVKAAAPVAPPAVQPLTLKPIEHDLVNALWEQGFSDESQIPIVHLFAASVIAEFCRINGLTLGGIGKDGGA